MLLFHISHVLFIMGLPMESNNISLTYLPWTAELIVK